MGRFPRVTHPSATRGRNHASDLHVLGMPPAFVLSQDQTLMFISRGPAPGSLPLRSQPPRPRNRSRATDPGLGTCVSSLRTRPPTVIGRRPRPSRSLSREISRIPPEPDARSGDLSPERSRRPKSSRPLHRPSRTGQNPPPSPRPPKTARSIPKDKARQPMAGPRAGQRALRTRRPRIPSSRLSTMSNSQSTKTNRQNKIRRPETPTRPPRGPPAPVLSTPQPGRPRLIRSGFINVNILVAYSS